MEILGDLRYQSLSERLGRPGIKDIHMSSLLPAGQHSINRSLLFTWTHSYLIFNSLASKNHRECLTCGLNCVGSPIVVGVLGLTSTSETRKFPQSLGRYGRKFWHDLA